jgi:hypothetical protein
MNSRKKTICRCHFVVVAAAGDKAMRRLGCANAEPMARAMLGINARLQLQEPPKP